METSLSQLDHHRRLLHGRKWKKRCNKIITFDDINATNCSLRVSFLIRKCFIAETSSVGVSVADALGPFCEAISCIFKQFSQHFHLFRHDLSKENFENWPVNSSSNKLTVSYVVEAVCLAVCQGHANPWVFQLITKFILVLW